MFKRCFVPSCANTSQNGPTKLFITIPKTASRRLWFKAVNLLPVSTPLYCCEDHFNLVEDSSNYQYNKLMMGSRIIMKKDVVPHLNIRSAATTKEKSQFSVPTKKRKLINATIAKPDTPTRKLLFVDTEEGAQESDSNSSRARVPAPHLDVQISNLKNDASNLDYYLTKRMKKLLFKPHALPKPVSIVTIEPPPPLLIKQEPEDYDIDDTINIKEEPVDLDVYEIKNEPIDIKIESDDDLCPPSPPPLVPAAQFSTNDQQQQQQQHPIVINSFQVANHQLRSQLLRLATQGRLRVVNVNNPANSSTTPTLAVLGLDGMTVNTAAGVIQTAVARQGPPQLFQRPMPVQTSTNQGQLPRVRMINMKRTQGGYAVAGGIAKQLISGQKMVNILPGNISVGNRPQVIPSSVIQKVTASPVITSKKPSILRHQLIVPKSSVTPMKLTTPTSQAPSLIPLPMRSVFACGKCTELFYTTNDRDRHIESKHPGSLHSFVKQYAGSKGANEVVSSDRAICVSGKRKMDMEAGMDFTCEFCLVNMPSSQKVEHLATHETFKCVICHQTLEKRIYATHMMSHIEDRPDTAESLSSQSRRKSSESLNVLPKKRSPPKINTMQSSSKPLDNQHDVTILEVKKTANNHPDVEENLDQYMIPRETVTKQSNSTAKRMDSSSKKKHTLQTCANCTKKFSTWDLLWAHQRREHKNNAFFTKCVFCWQNIAQSELDQHIRTMHRETYSCPQCPVRFAHRSTCIKHIRKVHSEESGSLSQPKYKRALAKVKDVSNSKVLVKTETRGDPEVIQDHDMDYDEDYPLSMLLQKNSENNNFVQELQRDEVQICCFPEDEGDDRPEYVDIAQYNVID